MGSEILTILLSAFALIITSLATWATQKLIHYLDSKINDTTIKQSMEQIEGIIEKVVAATCQTYVDGLKKTQAWTKETQQQALNNSLNTAKEMLSDESKNFIVDHYGDIDKWLETQIESCIYKLKNK